jgi:hypothetical protein
MITLGKIRIDIVRLGIAGLVFMMVQAVLFGVGTVAVLATPLQQFAMELMPAVVIVSTILSLPASWMLAPRLRARYWRARHRNGDFISGPADSPA